MKTSNYTWAEFLDSEVTAFRDCYSDQIHQALSHTDSPIEKDLLAALIVVTQKNGIGIRVGNGRNYCFRLPAGQPPSLSGPFEIPNCTTTFNNISGLEFFAEFKIDAYPQLAIGDYRVDLFLRTHLKSLRRPTPRDPMRLIEGYFDLVIECDGFSYVTLVEYPGADFNTVMFRDAQ